MRKRLLFVMNSLICGGAEKALVSLLQTIDYQQYKVDLLLFKQVGLFMNKIPEQVTILNPPPEYEYYDMPFKSAMARSLCKGSLGHACHRIGAGYVFKTEKNRARCEQRVWKFMSRSLGKLPGEYDVAIGYLEKNPVYYCIEKVQADIKIGFIHNDYLQLGMDPDLDMHYFAQLDHIVTVSEECVRVLQEQFPIYKEKIKLMYNIVSPGMIRKLSMDEVVLEANNDEVILLSIGRLHVQKGFDLAIEACKILKQKGQKIKWFIIGEGEERENLEQLIRRYDLQNTFILLGLRDNPYPYLRLADIYVQPSRFEGKSIAIDEAKIAHKPIIVTNFSTVTDQIEDGKNGLVVNMIPESLVEGILSLIENKELRIQLSRNLTTEVLGTESEIHKFYEMIS